MSVFKPLAPDAVALQSHPAHRPYRWAFSAFPRRCEPDFSEGRGADLTVLTARNLTGSSFDPATDPRTEGLYQRQLFAALQQRLAHRPPVPATASLPTGSGDTVRVFRLSREITGERWRPASFVLQNTNYRIADNGHGLLIETSGALGMATPVGQVLYEEGMAIVTHPDLQLLVAQPISAPDRQLTTGSVGTGSAPGCINLATGAWLAPSQSVAEAVLVSSSPNWSPSITGSSLCYGSLPPGEYSAIYRLKDAAGICSPPASVGLHIEAPCAFGVGAAVVSSSALPEAPCRLELVPLHPGSVGGAACDTEGPFVTAGRPRPVPGSPDDWAVILEADRPLTWSLSRDGGLTYRQLRTDATKIELVTNDPLLVAAPDRVYSGLLRVEASGSATVDYHLFLHPLTGHLDFELLSRHPSTAELASFCNPRQLRLSADTGVVDHYTFTTTGDVTAVRLGVDTLSVLGHRGSVSVTATLAGGTSCSTTLYLNGRTERPVACATDALDLLVIPTSVPNELLLRLVSRSRYGATAPAWTLTGNVEWLGGWGTETLRVRIYEGGGEVSVSLQNFCGTTLTASLPMGWMAPNPVRPPETTPMQPPTTGGGGGRPDYTLFMADLALTLQATPIELAPGGTTDVVALVSHQGGIDATGVVVAITLGEGLLFDSVLIPSSVSIAGSTLSASLPLIPSGQNAVIRFRVRATAPVGFQPLIVAQVAACDQIDPDSVPGVWSGEDDEAELRLFIRPVSQTTPQPCAPIIRPHPYTGYECASDTESTAPRTRGRLLIDAINPYTGNASGLEYSFLGDVETYYQPENRSGLVSDGLYTVWVRIADRPGCRQSVQIRVRCSKLSIEDWLMQGSFCRSTAPHSPDYIPTLNPMEATTTAAS